MKEQKRKTGVARLLEIAGTKKWLVIAACALGAAATFLQFFPVVLVYGGVMELVRHAGNLSAVNGAYMWRLALSMLACFAGFAVLLYVSNIISHIAAFNILYELRMRLAEKLSRLGLGFFTNSGSGAIKQVMSGDVESIELFVAHHTVDMTSAAAIPVIALVAMGIMDWRLMLAALVSVPLGIFIYARQFASPASQAAMEQYYKGIANLNSTAVEFVNGMPVLKIFNQTALAMTRFINDIKAHAAMQREWGMTYTGPYAGFVTIIGSPLSFILPVGVILGFFEADLAAYIPKLIFFLLVGGSMNIPLLKLMFLASLMQRNVEGVKHIDEILYAGEIPEAAEPKIPADSSVEFEAVVFSYGDREALRKVSFRVEPGQLLGIVGPSGGGKTTIAQLAARFWDIQGGHIRIGGVDIRDIAVSELMKRIAFVFQEVYLFRDTIENNIRMGNTQADAEDVRRAARAAQAEAFILKTPGGYGSVIGEGGVHLSGGEAQRIAIARAILKDAPVIILDEATAYADAENEAKIQAAFAELTVGKTVLVIAHRLSTIRHADNIVVVEEGRIVEQGGHDELMAKGGLYARLVEAYYHAQSWALDVRGEGK
ncbi:MAG: ABC transporter ATP-binding protein/permease [Treponema sp.]|jgi:ATP-binding cassette subfamily B protein|nr:ABC transporter ATP-binding protein/permease [Treponema sp.]